MKKSALRLSVYFAVGLSAALLHAAVAVKWPGLAPDGSIQLPNLWSLRPAGSHVELGDFPVNIAVAADGKFAVVLHSGYGQNELIAVSLAEKKITSRAKALVISPYSRKRGVDSTMYSTSSMLRTMELILGLQPMTQFDAAAAPMFNSFYATTNTEPFVALPAKVDLKTTNSVAAWGSEIKFNLAKEDAVDDLLFNEVIWRSVKGRNHAMPAPTHAGFVMVNAERDED